MNTINIQVMLLAIVLNMLRDIDIEVFEDLVNVTEALRRKYKAIKNGRSVIWRIPI